MLSSRLLSSLRRSSSWRAPLLPLKGKNIVRLGSNQSKSLKELGESFIGGTSANYIEQMYESWTDDPSSVHASWRAYFSGVREGVPAGEAFASPPQLGSQPTQSQSQSSPDHNISVKLVQLIRAYQVFGHLAADLDPLGLIKPGYVKELDPESFGITEEEMNAKIDHLDPSNLNSGYLANAQSKTVKELVDNLRKAYCDTIGVEYMHIADRDKSNWIKEHFENRDIKLTKEDRIQNFERLAAATKFEHFLGMKFNDKRFGCDGAEVIIPGLKQCIDTAADLGVEDIVLGMAHRGRLNVLANVLRKPMEDIFHEFQKGTTSKRDIASGDVKYHLGTSHTRQTRSGKSIHLSLMANPSHLEAVNPLVEGKIKAKLVSRGDTQGKTACPILIHGDASYAGQGIVYETITMSALPKYHTGGTIHVVLNNQIGFTTNPEDARPGRYCTDVSKTTKSPIFHVNGDDADAVQWTMKLAAQWRQTFHTDVVVDIICYRRFGHNEVDQPSFTQPMMYQHIKDHPQTLDIYSDLLIKEGVVSEEMRKQVLDEFVQFFEDGFAKSKNHQPKESTWLDSKWKGFKSPEQLARIKTTGVNLSKLKEVGKALCEVPDNFTPHPVIKKILKNRQQMLENDELIDWATAEQLAFGTLLSESYGVRLSGQDVERGTFSHRHAIVHDQKNGDEYCFLNNMPEHLQKETLQIQNSFLSENAAMGFELGYSINDPNTLVMWEAQFGDFFNGAQIILDQFLSSGEQKWMRQNGLVLLLPHAYEGMGPEHSSARIERFLQMCDQDVDYIPEITHEAFEQSTNWTVVNCSTPANYFHVLRRQLHREFRKPLIVFTPKSLLRHPLVKSPITAFDTEDEEEENSRFLRLYWETEKNLVPANEMKRVIFCSGKVYWDLYEERQKRGLKDIALLRIEQLAPFPFDKVKDEIQRYPNAHFVWAQEEPKNMGAWTFMFFNFRTTFKALNLDQEINYIGRKQSASPASGSAHVHKRELAQMLDEVFTY